jgi:hypothetical protein
VCPSACSHGANNSAPTRRILMKFDIWAFFFFRKSVEKIKVSSKYHKNNVYFTWRRFHIYDKSRWILLIMRNVSCKSCSEIRIHILCLKTFFPKNCAVYEIMSKNMVELERPHTTWRMLYKQCYTLARTCKRSCAQTPTCTHTNRNMRGLIYIFFSFCGSHGFANVPPC